MHEVCLENLRRFHTSQPFRKSAKSPNKEPEIQTNQKNHMFYRTHLMLQHEAADPAEMEIRPIAGGVNFRTDDNKETE